jgi:hypothetical protein
MSAGLVAQYVVIGVIVLVSVLAAVAKLAPQWSNRWQATGQCSDGCSTCGACGSKPPAAAKPGVMPLEFRSPAK